MLAENIAHSETVNVNALYIDFKALFVESDDIAQKVDVTASFTFSWFDFEARADALADDVTTGPSDFYSDVKRNSTSSAFETIIYIKRCATSYRKV
ncbi:hypothetical protein NDU88_001121 [Pleurodeles waltl]|uniref:Uncharacterized protein n=1 Tax=Pleurodeles waltl TaxID=8319 RepID=A0AAV7MTT7_PLEWA|nr:hypothetical protein NDU88_001121 [Pleurodeles waltl]